MSTTESSSTLFFGTQRVHIHVRSSGPATGPSDSHHSSNLPRPLRWLRNFNCTKRGSGNGGAARARGAATSGGRQQRSAADATAVGQGLLPPSTPGTAGAANTTNSNYVMTNTDHNNANNNTDTNSGDNNNPNNSDNDANDNNNTGGVGSNRRGRGTNNTASPSILYGREVAVSRKHESSDKPEHKFWVKSDIEDGIFALGDVYAGTVYFTPNNPTTLFLEENIGNCLVLPNYIGHCLTNTTNTTSTNYNEEICRGLFRQICMAVMTLHENHVIHRNLHLNHMLVDQQTGMIRLRGFQHAIKLDVDSLGREVLTTATLNNTRKYDWYAFRCPELDIEQFPHGRQVDVWSLGVTLYMLLTGLPPFRATGVELQDVKHHANCAPYEITQPSHEAQDLIKHMIQANPNDRYTLAQVLQHEWCQAGRTPEEATIRTRKYQKHDLSIAQILMQDWAIKKKPKSKKNNPNDNNPRRRHSRSSCDPAPSSIRLLM